MILFKNAMQIVDYQFKRWRKDYRIYVLAILIFILLAKNIAGILEFSYETGYRINPWIFPVLLESYFVSMGLLKVLLLFGMVLLFCDAPFYDAMKPYLIIRCGRRAGCIGEIIYIAAASFLYVLYVWGMSLLCLIPRISFHMKWGKVLGTLAMTEAGGNYAPTLCFNSQMISSYQPLEATILTFVNMWLFGIVIGLCIYTANILMKSKSVGVVLVSFFILMDPVFSYLGQARNFWFSPASWVSISRLNRISGSEYPTEGFALIIYLISIVALIGVINWKSRTKIVEINFSAN